jgi:hypothetical protein
MDIEKSKSSARTGMVPSNIMFASMRPSFRHLLLSWYPSASYSKSCIEGDHQVFVCTVSTKRLIQTSWPTEDTILPTGGAKPLGPSESKSATRYESYGGVSRHNIFLLLYHWWIIFSLPIIPHPHLSISISANHPRKSHSASIGMRKQRMLLGVKCGVDIMAQ